MNLEATISSLGLPAVAIGVGLEGEGVAFLGGVLAHRGFYPVEAAALVAGLAAVASDNAAFAAGRFAGHAGVVRRVLSTGAITGLRAAIDRRPATFTFVFRFLYGMRVPSAMLIGTTSISWALFFAIDLASSLVWAHIYVWLGFAGSAAIFHVLGELRLHEHLLIALAAAVLVAAVAWRSRRRLARRTATPVGSGG